MRAARPRRPRGLTIALLACTVLYGLYPLVTGLFFLLPAVGRPQYTVEPRVVLDVVLSLGFLALLVPAWRGRPPRIRLILTAAVIGLMLLNLGMAVYDLTSRSALTLDSTSQLSEATTTCSIPIYALLTLYIVWYLNRYPARAYYRGEAPAAESEAAHA